VKSGTADKGGLLYIDNRGDRFLHSSPACWAWACDYISELPPSESLTSETEPACRGESAHTGWWMQVFGGKVESYQHYKSCFF
jgi:hypothetical protein